MIAIEPYGDRYFALYEDGALIAVCCYRKGAEAVKQRLQELERRIEELEFSDQPSAVAEPR